MHDYPHDALGRAVPYGVYDVTANRGFIYLGPSGDTSAFAVDAIAGGGKATAKAPGLATISWCWLTRVAVMAAASAPGKNAYRWASAIGSD